MIFFAASSIPLWIVAGYLVLLLGLGIYSGTFFRGTSKDYFVARRSLGPVMLLMSVFGTTMTGFALVGSTGKAFTTGVATYGALAAWSGIVHSAVFFVIGMRLWAIGKRHGYVPQVQYFRARFNSKTLGAVLCSYTPVVAPVRCVCSAGDLAKADRIRLATRRRRVQVVIRVHDHICARSAPVCFYWK